MANLIMIEERMEKKMKRVKAMKKIVAVFLTCFMIFGMVPYQALASDSKSAGEVQRSASTPIIELANAYIWSTAASEKVLGDSNPDSYSGRTGNVSMVSGKNEYESGQIIVTAKESQVHFTVELSDLVDTNNAKNVIRKDNFQVYILKYVEVKVAPHNEENPQPGWYPDALLPQENAVAHGENNVPARQNKGAWLEYYIPEDTVAGTYTGTATVNVDGIVTNVPVSLKVYDVTIPTESSQKTMFTVSKDMVAYYEENSSAETMGKYYDMLLRYRCSPTSVAESDGMDANAFADLAYTYCRKGMSTVGLPSGNAKCEVDGFEVFDYHYEAQVIATLAQKSLKTNYNLIEKAAFYNYEIDEPFCIEYERGKVAAFIKAFDLSIEEAISILDADPAFTGTFAEQLRTDIRGIANVVTDYNTDVYGNQHRTTGLILNGDGSLFSYAGTSASVCAKPDAYHVEAERNTYQTDREKWWYNCNQPNYPYPGYHMDDTMTSAIMVEWMMAEYDIVGNLYWSVNRYWTLNSDGELNYPGINQADPYADAHRGTGSNGDGVLLYPGKTYGVDGPVASIRLDAIRDGYEDYELLRMIKTEYDVLGKDGNAAIAKLRESLYDGSQITGGATEYEAARECLLQSAEGLNTITFMGGSIRLPKGYDINWTEEKKNKAVEKADFRFGYLITLPEGTTMKDIDWSWEWKVDGTTTKNVKVKGVEYVGLGDNTYRTNLVITGIPMDTNYGMNICVTLKVSGKGNTESYIADDTRMRTVKFVADSVKRNIDNGTCHESVVIQDYVKTLIAWKSKSSDTGDNESIW